MGGSFFKDSITQVASKLCTHSLIQLPVSCVRRMAVSSFRWIGTCGSGMRRRSSRLLVSGKVKVTVGFEDLGSSFPAHFSSQDVP